MPNRTGKETLPVSFGRDSIHHFSKIIHCAEKGKRLKNKHLVRKREREDKNNKHGYTNFNQHDDYRSKVQSVIFPT